MAQEQSTHPTKRDQLRTFLTAHHCCAILSGFRASPAEVASGRDRVPDKQTDASSATTTQSSEHGTETGGDVITGPRRAEELPQDIIFDVLRNQRRRLVLTAVEEQNGSTTLRELAEHIASIENDKPSTALTAQERKRVYIGLYQCHLPKMADSDAILFDQHRGTVERGPRADQFHEYLERDSASTVAPYKYYSLLAGSSLFGFALATILFTSVSGLAYGLPLLLLLGLVAVHAAPKLTDPSSERTI